MNLRRLWAMMWKEYLHLLRDWRSLGLGIILPLFMMFMFSYALSLDVDHVPLAVWDQSKSYESRDLISHFAGSRYFSIIGSFSSYRGLLSAIEDGTAMMALTIPSNFARRIRRGHVADIQVLLDGSDAATARIALGYATAITQTYSQRANLRRIRQKGIRLKIGSVDMRPAVWFNPELESKNFIIPGLIAIVMMVIAGLLTSLTIAREWENGTMEQLITSPVKGAEIILGKLVPYFTLGMFDMALSIIVGTKIFGVPLRGSIFLLFFLSGIFLIGTLGIGLFVSAVAKKQLVANELAVLLTFLPSFMLSGFVYPISNMPKVIQWISYGVPARYFIVVLRGIYLKGVGIDALLPEAGFLTAFAFATITLSHLAFKKRVT